MREGARIPDQGAGGAPVRQAATVVVMRDGVTGPEVLLTRRPATMTFGPGLHVFPGGALDPSDADPRLLARLRRRGDEPASHAGAFMVAAIRELLEEAGVLLATSPAGAIPPASIARHQQGTVSGDWFASSVIDTDLELRGDWLVPLSRWVTPPVHPRRFDARFFVARLPDGAAPAFDPREVVSHAWMSAADALTAMADGRIELWTPTSTTLQQLAPATGIDDVRRYLAPTPETAPGKGSPAIDRPARSVTRVRSRGAGAIAGQTVDTYLVGDRRLAVVDPGDPADEAVDTILRVAEGLGARLTAVLLTAPVPDHAAGVESLALRLGIPVRAAAGARRVLVSDVEPLVDGEVVTDADVPIRVHVTPGTHPDHLAFEVPGAGVVLVGDLEGPGPSRTIPGAVNEAALARSRAEVRALGDLRHLAAHD